MFPREMTKKLHSKGKFYSKPRKQKVHNKASDFNLEFVKGPTPSTHLYYPNYLFSLILHSEIWPKPQPLSSPGHRDLRAPNSITALSQINEVTLKETHSQCFSFLADNTGMLPSFHT